MSTDTPPDIPSAAFDALFHEYVAAAYDKQVYLVDSIGAQHKWEFDMDSGTISFNEQLRFNMQILGTQSEEVNTWLWGWANTMSSIPDRLLVEAAGLREFGKARGITELTTAEFPISEQLDGVRIAMVASGLREADCYYRGEYPGGAVYLLIQDPSFVRGISQPLLRIARVFPEVLQNITVRDPKLAFEHYLRFYQLEVTSDGSTITGKAPTGGHVVGTFDEQGRLQNLESETA